MLSEEEYLCTVKCVIKTSLWCDLSVILQVPLSPFFCNSWVFLVRPHFTDNCCSLCWRLAALSRAVTSILQIDVSFPECLSGSWEIFCYAADERATITFIWCCGIWERRRTRCDGHLYLMGLYTISISSWLLSQGGLWDKEGFQAAVVWALIAAACVSCWCMSATVWQNHCQGLSAQEFWVEI